VGGGASSGKDQGELHEMRRMMEDLARRMDRGEQRSQQDEVVDAERAVKEEARKREDHISLDTLHQKIIRLDEAARRANIKEAKQRHYAAVLDRFIYWRASGVTGIGQLLVSFLSSQEENHLLEKERKFFKNQKGSSPLPYGGQYPMQSQPFSQQLVPTQLFPPQQANYQYQPQHQQQYPQQYQLQGQQPPMWQQPGLQSWGPGPMMQPCMSPQQLPPQQLPQEGYPDHFGRSSPRKSPRKGSYGQSYSFSPRSPSRFESDDGKCFICNLPGHFKRDCPNRSSNNNHRKKCSGGGTVMHVGV